MPSNNFFIVDLWEDIFHFAVRKGLLTISGQWAVNRSDMYHTSGPKYLRVGMSSPRSLPCPGIEVLK